MRAYLFYLRLRSCEAASNLLEKYRNEAQEEKIEMQRYENDLRTQKIEDLGPSEAELEAERLKVTTGDLKKSHLKSAFLILFLFRFSASTA